MTLLDRSMTSSCEIVRQIADGERVEGELRAESVRFGPYACRLALDKPGDSDPHSGRQLVRGRVYIGPEAAIRAGDAFLIDDVEWRVASVTRLVRRRREIAVEAAVTRLLDHE